LVIAAVVLALILVFSFMSGDRYLKTEAAERAEVQGTFTLVLYGCRYQNDLETFAVLDKEGDPYVFEVYAPDFNYRIKHGLSVREALQLAEQHVRCHINSDKTRFSKILGPTGNTIGFELRPLYDPLTFGIDDVLTIQYAVKEQKVIVHIQLDPNVEMVRAGS